MLREIAPSNKAVPVGCLRVSMPGGEKMFKIFGELNDGTDRAAAIIGGSLVELSLQREPISFHIWTNVPKQKEYHEPVCQKICTQGNVEKRLNGKPCRPGYQ